MIKIYKMRNKSSEPAQWNNDYWKSINSTTHIDETHHKNMEKNLNIRKNNIKLSKTFINTLIKFTEFFCLTTAKHECLRQSQMWVTLTHSSCCCCCSSLEIAEVVILKSWSDFVPAYIRLPWELSLLSPYVVVYPLFGCVNG